MKTFLFFSFFLKNELLKPGNKKVRIILERVRKTHETGLVAAQKKTCESLSDGIFWAEPERRRPRVTPKGLGLLECRPVVGDLPGRQQHTQEAGVDPSVHPVTPGPSVSLFLSKMLFVNNFRADFHKATPFDQFYYCYHYY